MHVVVVIVGGSLRALAGEPGEGAFDLWGRTRAPFP